MRGTELELGYNHDVHAVMDTTDFPDITIIPEEDSSTTSSASETDVALGTKAIEQVILSASDGQADQKEQQIIENTHVPDEDEQPEPADSIKKPPTPPKPPTTFGSPDDGEQRPGEEWTPGSGDNSETHPPAAEETAPEELPPPQDAIEVRPVEGLVDTLAWSGPSMRDRPSDGYYATSNDLYDKLNAMVDGETSEAMQTDVTHQIALRNMLSGVGFGPGEQTNNVQRDTEMTASFDSRIEGVSIPALEARAAELAPPEVLDYFIGKLESYTAFLANGQQPANWPEAAALGGLTGDRVPQAMTKIAETVELSLAANPELEGADALKDRHQAWIEDTASLLLSSQHIALAAPLINGSSEASAPALLNQVRDAMTVLKESGQEGEYRKLYSFMTQTLEPGLAEQFIEQNEHLSTPLIPGSRREMIDQGGSPVLQEEYTENHPFGARLAEGTPIELPYTKPEVRVITNYGLPTEHESPPMPQSAVRYEELDDAAKGAIETAWQAEDEGRLRVETMPDYKRLALKPTSESESTLHTVSLRDGFNRTVHPYPDDHGLVTSETEEQIDRAVVSAQPVSSGYMVVPYNGGYMPQATYRDAEPNFYGPGKEQANAFWISGSPQRVIEAPDSIKYYKYEDEFGDGSIHRSPRWTIIPVTYYKVEEQQQGDDNSDEHPRYGP